MPVVLDPVAKAKWVLATKGVFDTPAPHLDRIAHSEHIRVLRRSLPSEKGLSGTLIYRGDKTGILINTYVDNNGRHNFTFAHELGHYFLQHQPPYVSDGESGFRCSNQDMEAEQGQLADEVEANRFAAELLMPEVLFSPLLAGSPFDFTLIGGLANQFHVSKHASGNRILDFIRDPYVLISTRGTTITSIKCSREAKPFLITHKKISQGTAAHDAIINRRNMVGFLPSNTTKWIPGIKRCMKVYEWTRGDYVHNVAMTILKIEL